MFAGIEYGCQGEENEDINSEKDEEMTQMGQWDAN